MEDLDNFNILNTKVLNCIEKNTLYTVSVKIRYRHTFFMAGKQCGFINKELEDIKELNNIISERLTRSFEDYSLTDNDVLYIQLTFKKVNSKIISEFGISDNSIKSKGFTGGFFFL